MKYLAVFLGFILGAWLLIKILRGVIEVIKEDPIANLVAPVVTSVLVYAVLQWL